MTLQEQFDEKFPLITDMMELVEACRGALHTVPMLHWTQTMPVRRPSGWLERQSRVLQIGAVHFVSLDGLAILSQHWPVKAALKPTTFESLLDVSTLSLRRMRLYLGQVHRSIAGTSA